MTVPRKKGTETLWSKHKSKKEKSQAALNFTESSFLSSVESNSRKQGIENLIEKKMQLQHSHQNLQYVRRPDLDMLSTEKKPKRVGSPRTALNRYDAMKAYVNEWNPISAKGVA